MAKAAKYVCIKACFYRSRRWEPGETLVPQSGDIVPKHFKVAIDGEASPAVEEKPVVTFSQMVDDDAENEKKRAAELEQVAKKRFGKGKGKG